MAGERHFSLIVTHCRKTSIKELCNFVRKGTTKFFLIRSIFIFKNVYYNQSTAQEKYS